MLRFDSRRTAVAQPDKRASPGEVSRRLCLKLRHALKADVGTTKYVRVITESKPRKQRYQIWSTALSVSEG